MLGQVDIDFDEDELVDLDRRRGLGQMAWQHCRLSDGAFFVQP